MYDYRGHALSVNCSYFTGMLLKEREIILSHKYNKDKALKRLAKLGRLRRCNRKPEGREL